ncbi:HEAT repeat domain-containing protein [Limisalsivibrio acetivorans]|uniref:HEAT repeat domain-containing protein n=1 Tax=Limisalsivibrio acetivorans TaxID=1304888 RepID=UPI0003B37591|nr:HEAT repeat domain-containing protein [Limisalsivibrio acetivorans]
MGAELQKDNGCLKIILEQDEPIASFNNLVKTIAGEQGLNRVILDLKNCFYLQSKALASILAMKKEAQKKKSEFILVNVSEEVFQLLEMTNLLPLFTISDDYSSYEIDELIEKFLDAEEADKASDFLAENYNDEIRKRLFEVLDMDDALLEEYAVLTIGKAHDFDAVDKIAACLESDAGVVVRAAILVLGWMGETEYKQRIYDFLKSDIVDVAEAAAGSIALLADDSDAEIIGSLLSNDSKRLRKVAAQALSLINDEKSFEILVNHLEKEQDEDVRAQVVKSVASFNRQNVADLLLKYFDDSSLKVREVAAGGLVRIKAKDRIGEIMARVNDNDSWVGYFAAKALGEICTADCVEPLKKVYPDVEDNVKLAIIEALGKIDFDTSDFLLSLIDDENEDIRKEVIGTLQRLNSSMAVEAAVKLIEKDDSWLVRFKCVEILDNSKPKSYMELLKKRLESEDNRYVREKIQSILEAI